MTDYLKINADEWTAPESPDITEFGDMPKDNAGINPAILSKAAKLFPVLLKHCQEHNLPKTVISVYGGSGSGKTSIASALAYYFNDLGIGTYLMSGDNYPHRIPEYNDRERMRVYEEKGEVGLKEYLGSEYEINFKEVTEIIRQFHEGRSPIFLRRMGREPEALWYDPVPFTDIQILILEWTHGNNANIEGIDIPVFLESAPEETAGFRRARGRDKDTDSPFVSMVLKIEQALIESQRPTAEIIVGRNGEIK